MNTIRCLLVDDEPPAIELLQKYTSMVDQLDVVGTSYSAVRAFELVDEKSVDLIFLDIQMPVLNGLDFIKTLKNPPAIILTTAYREYALEAYDLDIIDYLLKPIAFDRFLRAVDRYRERTIPVATPAPVSKTEDDHIFCNINRTQHKVLLNEILYVESLKDYIRLHTTHSKLVVKGNIGSFMKRLPASQFVRIHRSFAVALAQVRSYNQSEVVVKDQTLPIGVRYRDDFLGEMKS